MLQGLLSGLVDKESVANDMITNILEKVARESGIKASSFFIMIKAKNNDFDFGLQLWSTESGQPKYVKDLSLKELLK